MGMVVRWCFEFPAIVSDCILFVNSMWFISCLAWWRETQKNPLGKSGTKVTVNKMGNINAHHLAICFYGTGNEAIHFG